MAGASKSDDLKFINSFEKDLKSDGASGEKPSADSLRMSSFVKDIDAIGRGSSTTTMTTNTATTTIDDIRTTPDTDEHQANTNPTTEALHGHEICPSPLPWSPHQHFQGPMCGCHDSNWCQGGTTAHDQSEAQTS